MGSLLFYLLDWSKSFYKHRIQAQIKNYSFLSFKKNKYSDANLFMSDEEQYLKPFFSWTTALKLLV